jgi:hypothetical protein
MLNDKTLENLFTAMIPGGIEAQEAQGQRALCQAVTARLPKKLGITESRNYSNAEKLYNLLGIEVLGEYDDLFLNVKLPEGWKIEPTEHSMTSKLFDNKNRERATIFYKAAFYDRKAHFSLDTRFHIQVEPEDAYQSGMTSNERRELPLYGRVYDQGEIVFQTEGEQQIRISPETVDAYDEQYKRLGEECNQWLIDNNYPEYNNPLKYWEE